MTNAANLMKAIKDTLRASKLARSIPNNILVSSPTFSKLKGRDWDVIHTERGMKAVGCMNDRGERGKGLARSLNGTVPS